MGYTGLMDYVPPFELEFYTRGFDCGYGGPQRLDSLANFFQECAGGHAQLLGLGVDRLRAEGKTWMLSRLDMRIDELPEAWRRVFVSTWPAGVERLFALRDIAMKSAEGRSLVRAVYAYLIVDLAARRPLRPERFFADTPFGAEGPRGADPHPVEGHRFSIPGATAFEVSFAQRASARHIDHNGHVNNAHIIDWLADAVPRRARGSGSLCALRVEFLAEALEGEDFEAAWSPVDEGAPGTEDAGGIVSELRRAGSGAVAARAWTLWS
jgi:medium-chain acyl-[acyl-carrier-protein] hydrolase